LVEIVPTVEFPPVTLFTAQVTLVLLLPVTAALNCSVCPSFTVAVVGLIDTVTVPFRPPHPQVQTTASKIALQNSKRRIAIPSSPFQPLVPVCSLMPLHPVLYPSPFRK
jgi:hypothetical protein